MSEGLAWSFQGYAMERHFLEGQIEGPQEFKAEPWYNPHGDCVVFQTANEAIVGDRIDEILTIYRSAKDDRPIGFQIKDVLSLIRRFGLDGLAFLAETQGEEITKVSITMLLLAAYEEGPRTSYRRQAYASVMRDTHDTGIPREELVPA